MKGLSDPEDQLGRLLRTWTDEFERRPLLLRSHRAPQQILRAAEGRALPELREQVIERITPLVEDIQKRSDGYIVEGGPEVILELLSLLELVAANREAHDEVGWSGYDTFKEILITILKRGLLGD